MKQTKKLPVERRPLEESFIARVEVEDLFGLYTYRLGPTPSADAESRRLFLLYGDNGSGKTTVLRLIFNLLSQATNQGHRGYLGRTPFRRLSVTLGEGTSLTVSRPSGALTGDYHVSVVRKEKRIVDAMIAVDDQGKVRAPQPDLDAFVRVLVDLNIDLYFLTDDRKGRSSAAVDNEQEHDRMLVRVYQEELARGRPLRDVQLPDRSETRLEVTIGRFDAWVRNQALVGSTTGELNTNSVYADIIQRIAKPRRGRPAGSERDLAELLTTMGRLEDSNRRYAEFGLTSRLNIEPIVAATDGASPATTRIIASVLGPYVDGIQARLQALESIQHLLEVFIESLNSFLNNKSASFSLRVGLQIRSRNGELLSSSMLSSGERQLLLLLCDTVLARDDATIFLIDEPEISLNVKWQRTLLDALLRLTVDSPVQFVIATHSLELLARHRTSIRQLADENAASVQ